MEFNLLLYSIGKYKYKLVCLYVGIIYIIFV